MPKALDSCGVNEDHRAGALEAVQIGVARYGSWERIYRILGWAGLATAVGPIVFDTVQHLATRGSLQIPQEHIGIGIGATGIGMIGLAVANGIRARLECISRMLSDKKIS